MQFIISGTQTGGLESLSRQHYSHVLEANPIKNCIRSTGEKKPSSEALTHASVYHKNNKIQSVIHIHSPEIWKNTKQLKLACTSAGITYGTPEMAKEVERLMKTEQLKNNNIFSMLGHEDGIIAFSDSIEDAALSLIKYYSKAVGIEQNQLKSEKPTP
jgi:ribulose-5-phosphate 4-epimerase/fuculose-1-phosphate aldolase